MTGTTHQYASHVEHRQRVEELFRIRVHQPILTSAPGASIQVEPVDVDTFRWRLADRIHLLLCRPQLKHFCMAGTDLSCKNIDGPKQLTDMQCDIAKGVNYMSCKGVSCQWAAFSSISV